MQQAKLLDDNTMLFTPPNAEAAFTSFFDLLHDKTPNSEEANRKYLGLLLDNIGPHISKPFTIATTLISKKRSVIANVYLATAALMHGKLTFFETILERYSAPIYMDSCPSNRAILSGPSLNHPSSISVSTPLKIAIFYEDPQLVKTVINNKYFIRFQAEQTKKCKTYIENCMKQASDWYGPGVCTKDQENILSILRGL